MFNPITRHPAARLAVAGTLIALLVTLVGNASAVSVAADGKAGVVVGVTADLTSRFSAVDLVKIASEALGGKGGGGRPDMAQAGGTDPAPLPAALASVKGWVEAKL